MSSLKIKLGARIQEIRKSKNITQEKLAEAIGLNVPNLSNIERGKKFVTAETLERIINALEIKESDLFDFGHIKTRKELLDLINDILSKASDKDIQYFYRMMSLYKEF